MVKIIILISFLLITNSSALTYEKACLSCHAQEFKLQMFIKKYTIKYSSEEKIKNAIFKYMKNPDYKTSVLPFGYLRRFGIKKKSKLSDDDLKKMIDIYYKKYNIKSKIY